MQIHIMKGSLLNDPELGKDNYGVSVVNFKLSCKTKYNTSNGPKWENVVYNCEAWDSGAEFISRNFRANDTILVNCSAKLYNQSTLKFRINHFEPINVKNDTETCVEI